VGVHREIITRDMKYPGDTFNGVIEVPGLSVGLG